MNYEAVSSVHTGGPFDEYCGGSRPLDPAKDPPPILIKWPLGELLINVRWARAPELRLKTDVPEEEESPLETRRVSDSIAAPDLAGFVLFIVFRPLTPIMLYGLTGSIIICSSCSQWDKCAQVYFRMAVRIISPISCQQNDGHLLSTMRHYVRGTLKLFFLFASF